MLDLAEVARHQLSRESQKIALIQGKCPETHRSSSFRLSTALYCPSCRRASAASAPPKPETSYSACRENREIKLALQNRICSMPLSRHSPESGGFASKGVP